jgi:CheY-like chemotaxis protein
MARPARYAGSDPTAGQVRVLHVDDDAALRDLTADLLERVDEGMTVLSEADPRAVPERLEAETVDCLVTDKCMPRRDGLELCREVREDHPDLPVVVFTSQRGEGVVERAMAAGATDYVPKAPGVDQYEILADRVRRAVLERRRDRCEESETATERHSTA